VTGEFSALEALGAIGLAVEAGATDRARVQVLREILKRAPEPVRGDTRSVQLLIEAVRASNAGFHVTDDEPHGRVVRNRAGVRAAPKPLSDIL
jgi:hypothetical protein